MPDANRHALSDLMMAHRILVRENVLDAFGHISLRDANDPSRFWLASALPPSVVEVEDFARYGMDGEPVEAPGRPLFSERHIHSEIYKVRPDVGAICHHHAAAVLPFCIGAGPLFAVSQTGAFLGERVPLWDSADDFGDTSMLVTEPRQAASLARALGGASVVLMRGHGATVVGANIQDVVYKAVYSSREADLLRAAGATVTRLTAGEIQAAGHPKLAALARCWTHWTEGAERGVRTKPKEPHS